MSQEHVSKTTAPAQSEQQSPEGGVTMRPPAFQLQASGAPIQRAENECSTETAISPGNEAYLQLIATAKADEATALKILGLGAVRGQVMHDLMRNGRYDVVKAVITNAGWFGSDNLTCELLTHCNSADLMDASNDLLKLMYDSLDVGWTGSDEQVFMDGLKAVMEAKKLLPTEEVCEQAPASAAKETFDPKTLKPVADYKSGSKAGKLF